MHSWIRKKTAARYIFCEMLSPWFPDRKFVWCHTSGNVCRKLWHGNSIMELFYFEVFLGLISSFLIVMWLSNFPAVSWLIFEFSDSKFVITFFIIIHLIIIHVSCSLQIVFVLFISVLIISISSTGKFLIHAVCSY